MTSEFVVYFHRDFDGLCSAALFSVLLDSLFDTSQMQFLYVDVDYDVKDRWLQNPLHKPNAVLDFLYHPDADWWFDHHVSTFLEPAHRKRYKNGPRQFWDIDYDSCPGLLRQHFLNYYPLFGQANLDRFSEWIHWSNVIDGAKYSSPSEVFDYRHPCLQINASLAREPDSSFFRFLIEEIRHKSPDEVARTTPVKRRYERVRYDQQTAIDEAASLMCLSPSQIVFTDLTDSDVPFMRYLPYYRFPEASYAISVYNKSGKFSVSVGKNPWKEFSSKNIGEICRTFGGGGEDDCGSGLI